MTSKSKTEIEGLIPHRTPMLLVDSVMEQTEDEIVCEKKFESEEFFVQGHFPDYPLVPGVILCECCLQAGAILLATKAEAENVIPVATRIDGAKFKQMVRPGDVVEIRATLKETVSSAFFLSGKVSVGGKLAVRLDFACTLAPKPAD